MKFWSMTGKIFTMWGIEPGGRGGGEFWQKLEGAFWVLQVRVLGLAAIATKNSHFSELGVRCYPKIFDFLLGFPQNFDNFGFSPRRFSGGRSFPALSPPRSDPRPQLTKKTIKLSKFKPKSSG